MESVLTPPKANGITRAPATAATARLALVAMALLMLAAWLLQHPYLGIVHDSTVYSLLALARLHPDTLGTDIFLRFGSQGEYTIFGPLYAKAIAFLDLEPAAALLTLASQFALFGCAWLVARRFMPALDATFAVALLIALPGAYGSGIYFQYVEPFITPRLPAEALVLGALAATLARRYWTALGCILLATLLHPIMAASGVAIITLTFVAPVRPRLTLATGAVLLAGSLLIAAAIAPVGRLDAAWLQIVRTTSPFLYPSMWSAGDWSHVAAQLAVPTIGLFVGATPLLRRVCAGSLLTVACGLAITILYCDVLHIALFTDLQAWRWLWIAEVLAIALSPAIARDCWHSGTAGRAAVVLLGGAWIAPSDNATFGFVAGALTCAAIRTPWREHRYARLVLFGSWAALLVTATSNLIDRLAYLPPGYPGISVLLSHLRFVCGDGLIPGALLILAWIQLRRSESLAPRVIVTAAAVLACGVLVPSGYRAWTDFYYTPALANKFASWRAEIPPHAEVLWPDNPAGSWYLLSRPSYWSLQQGAGAIFSREKSLLMQRRNASITAALAGVGAAPITSQKLTLEGLRTVCSDADLSYVVSWMSLRATPFPGVAPDPAKPNSRLYLYRCSDLRSQP